MKTFLAVIFALGVLTGCGCDKTDAACLKEQSTAQPTAYVSSSEQNAPQTSRVTVSRVGVVADALAYGGARGIYIIKDTQTGREYIGVSGVGIADNGVHQVGKSQQRDER